MSNFNDLIQSETPVLVDFFAEWCGPCKMMTPILKEVKDELKDEIKIVKVDVDKNINLATKHKVRGVPTLALYQKGQLLWRQSGLLYKNDLIQIVNNYIHN
ncbi:MAG: thioredoxin [Polaribacter sp.]|jgi:thioredoxin 1